MLNIRPVQINDINAIRQVAKETWANTYKNIYSTDFIIRFLDNAYSEASLERSIRRDEEQHERNFFVAVSDDNEVIGYAHVRLIETETYELLRIYVLPSFQGYGVGSLFIKEIKNRIKTLKKLRAWVESDNTNGRGFYNSKGFQVMNEKTEEIEGMAIRLIEYELIFKDSPNQADTPEVKPWK